MRPTLAIFKKLFNLQNNPRSGFRPVMFADFITVIISYQSPPSFRLAFGRNHTIGQCAVVHLMS